MKDKCQKSNLVQFDSTQLKLMLFKKINEVINFEGTALSTSKSHLRVFILTKVPPSRERRSQKTERQVICKAPEEEPRLSFRHLANHMLFRSLTATFSTRWDFIYHMDSMFAYKLGFPFIIYRHSREGSLCSPPARLVQKYLVLYTAGVQLSLVEYLLW